MMVAEERHSGPHLRLVEEPDKIIDAESLVKCREHQQLAFPYPEVSTAFFLRIDRFTREEFARTLGNLTPRWIIDVRAVPRLDTVARSRSSAFDLFANAKVEYIDLFGRLGIRSYKSADANPVFWSRTVLRILAASERKGPYFFLFDDEELLFAADRILAPTLKSLVGSSTRIAHINQSVETKVPSP